MENPPLNDDFGRIITFTGVISGFVCRLMSLLFWHTKLKVQNMNLMYKLYESTRKLTAE